MDDIQEIVNKMIGQIGNTIEKYEGVVPDLEPVIQNISLWR